jgi:hypothetical protein
MASATVTATRGADMGNVASIPAKTAGGHKRGYIDLAEHAVCGNRATIVWYS